jgi:hypothetical protein
VKRAVLWGNASNLSQCLKTAFLVTLTSATLLDAQTNPVNIANWYGDYWARSWDGVALSGPFLYATTDNLDDPGLHLLNVYNPTNPVDLGYVGSSNSASGIIISAASAYVGRGSGIEILNISTPTSPVPISHIDAATALGVSGQYLYLSGASTSAVYSVADPANPVCVGPLPAARAIAVSDDYAYLATQDPSLGDILVCDISDPANATSVSSVHTPYDVPDQLIVSGNNLYAAAYGWHYRSLWIFDISNRTNLVPVKTLGGMPTFSSVGYRLRVAGNYAYMAGGSLDVYDVSDPTNTYRVASVQMPVNEFAAEMVVRQNYAYIAQSDGIGIYSLGNPAPPPLKINSCNNNTVVVSWPAPSAAFAVQQTSKLLGGTWTTLTNQPLVAGSRNQVVLSHPSGNLFYRLISQ